MATKILLKKSNVNSAQPQTSDLDYGELAINYEDGVLYYKTNSGVIDVIARKTAGGTSGITINPITANYTASGGDFLLANTSGGSFTITLPPAPVTGSFITIFDGDSWTDNPLIIDSGINSIEGDGSTINVGIGNVRIDFCV